MSVYPYTGLLGAYYELYMGLMPFLWPIYLIPYTGTIFLTVLVSVNRYEAVCRPFSTAKLCGNDKVIYLTSIIEMLRCVHISSHLIFAEVN